MISGLCRLLSVVLLVALSACSPGGDDAGSRDSAAESTSSPSGSAAPQDSQQFSGELIEGTGYVFNAPEGWSASSGENTGMKLDAMVLKNVSDGEFQTNLNVIVLPSPAMTAQQRGEQGAEELRTVGAEDITINDPVSLDGVDAAHLSAIMALGEVRYRVDQFLPTAENQGIVVTLSTPEDATPAERASAYEPVVESWAFTD